MSITRSIVYMHNSWTPIKGRWVEKDDEFSSISHSLITRRGHLKRPLEAGHAHHNDKHAHYHFEGSYVHEFFFSVFP